MWDEERKIARGQELLTIGVPDPPSNMDMHCVSFAVRQRQRDDADYQTFINNFDTFMGELLLWAQRSQQKPA